MTSTLNHDEEEEQGTCPSCGAKGPKYHLCDDCEQEFL